MSITRLELNLSWGSAAVGMVASLGIRSSNSEALIRDNSEAGKKKRQEIERLLGDDKPVAYDPRTNQDVYASNSVRGKWTTFCVRNSPGNCMTAQGVQRLAQFAAGLRAGNCQEKDALAIMYLNSLGVRQLDIMELNTHSTRVINRTFVTGMIDHTFVVIGRKRGSTPENPGTWGPDAVVCDPWHNFGKAYPATEIDSEMYRGYSGTEYQGPIAPVSLFRIE